jgi:hypothetical protein
MISVYVTVALQNKNVFLLKTAWKGFRINPLSTAPQQKQRGPKDKV